MTPTIAERVAQLESTVGTLKQTMEKVELHMIRANTYFDRAEGAMDSQDEAKKRNWKIAAIAAPFLLGLLAWGGSWLSSEFNVLKNVQQIEQEWKQAHPSEFVKPQSMQQAPDPQDATTELAK